VKSRLVALGVSEARLFAMGYGVTQPLSPNASDNARIAVAKMK
jgi:outer membrane protein OmpA-like peptidoglycan-associated protein